MLSPGLASSRDQSSNVYRVLENYDILFTLRAHPFTGVGFGQQFYMAVPLPDISFYVWWQYITHNSILWIWLKTGLGGFLSLLFMVGFSLMTGIQSLLRIKDRELKAAAFVAVFYIVTHFIYAYVDMSWDSRSMVYVGTMLGLINCIDLIAARAGLLEGKGRTRQSGPVAITLPS